MEQPLSDRNIFKKIDSVKGNKINLSYRSTVSKLNKFTNRFKDFLNYIENSLDNGMNKKKDFSYLKNKSLEENEDLSIYMKKKLKPIPIKKIKKTIFKMKGAKSLLNEENKNNILKNYVKDSNELKLNNSLKKIKILKNIKKNNQNFLKTMRNFSMSNYKIIDDFDNIDKNKFTNSSINKNKNKKNIIICREISGISNSKEESKSKTLRPKNKTLMNFKNLSLSLYKPNKSYFSHYKNELKPQYLMEFVNKSNKIQNSYKNDLEINLPKKDQKLLKIAQNEINMKDPEYHQKQIFKNILYVKKTLKYVRKMRNEHKVKVKYSGIGNTNNESIMRKKNANLLRFCDNICHMTDDKFYRFSKVLNEIYPTLTKEVFKEKYQVSEKNYVNEMRCNENLLKIERLFLAMQK